MNGRRAMPMLAAVAMIAMLGVDLPTTPREAPPPEPPPPPPPEPKRVPERTSQGWAPPPYREPPDYRPRVNRSKEQARRVRQQERIAAKGRA